MHILFADDTPETRELFQYAFGFQGHSICLAVDGAQAVAAVQERRFDAIVLDIEMPGLDGLGAARQIRALPHGQSVPIVLFTGYNYSQQAALVVGADLLLHKPLLPQTLLEHLQRLVRDKQSRPPLREGVPED